MAKKKEVKKDEVKEEVPVKEIVEVVEEKDADGYIETKDPSILRPETIKGTIINDYGTFYVGIPY